MEFGVSITEETFTSHFQLEFFYEISVLSNARRTLIWVWSQARVEREKGKRERGRWCDVNRANFHFFNEKSS